MVLVPFFNFKLAIIRIIGNTIKVNGVPIYLDIKSFIASVCIILFGISAIIKLIIQIGIIKGVEFFTLVTFWQTNDEVINPMLK